MQEVRLCIKKCYEVVREFSSFSFNLFARAAILFSIFSLQKLWIILRWFCRTSAVNFYNCWRYPLHVKRNVIMLLYSYMFVSLCMYSPNVFSHVYNDSAWNTSAGWSGPACIFCLEREQYWKPFLKASFFTLGVIPKVVYVSKDLKAPFRYVISV